MLVGAVFIDVGNEYAREKASQVLRDAVALLPESDTAEKDNTEVGKKQDSTEDAPELAVEHSDAKPTPVQGQIQVPATTMKNFKRKDRSPSNHGFYSNYIPAPQSWHLQAVPSSIQGPPLKRQRSNNFFDRSAFFALHGKGDSARSLGTFPGSPCLSRQGSLSGALPGALSAPLLLEDHDINAVPDLMSSLERGTSDEFCSDFY